MVRNRDILLTFLFLGISVLLFGIYDWDSVMQDYLYNFNTQQWLLDRHAQPYEFVFYSGLKRLLIIFAAMILLALIFLKKKSWLQPYRKGMLIVVLSAILVPLVTGGIKKYTNMPCPKNEIHYGGIYPKTAVWEHYKAPYDSYEHIRCWPAGHASGGFALMSLFFLFVCRRNRYMALGLSIMTGWIMGGYKMLIGDHFFSHTWITMLLAWLLILLIAKSVKILVKEDF